MAEDTNTQTDQTEERTAYGSPQRDIGTRENQKEQTKHAADRAAIAQIELELMQARLVRAEAISKADEARRTAIATAEELRDADLKAKEEADKVRAAANATLKEQGDSLKAFNQKATESIGDVGEATDGVLTAEDVSSTSEAGTALDAALAVVTELVGEVAQASKSYQEAMALFSSASEAAEAASKTYEANRAAAEQACDLARQQANAQYELDAAVAEQAWANAEVLYERALEDVANS